jgi:hypothetical protein
MGHCVVSRIAKRQIVALFYKNFKRIAAQAQQNAQERHQILTSLTIRAVHTKTVSETRMKSISRCKYLYKTVIVAKEEIYNRVMYPNTNPTADMS